MSDKCYTCSRAATVGVGSGSYSYSVCDKCWTDIKRGAISIDYDKLEMECFSDKVCIRIDNAREFLEAIDD